MWACVTSCQSLTPSSSPTRDRSPAMPLIVSMEATVCASGPVGNGVSSQRGRKSLPKGDGIAAPSRDHPSGITFEEGLQVTKVQSVPTDETIERSLAQPSLCAAFQE